MVFCGPLFIFFSIPINHKQLKKALATISEKQEYNFNIKHVRNFLNCLQNNLKIFELGLGANGGNSLKAYIYKKFFFLILLLACTNFV